MYPKKELAHIVISACSQFKIDTVIISPGSRNAPLTIGFSNHPNFKTMSIVDERCAAFFALGIAQQTQNPVAVVCTSGSALLNYYPAIAEAFYSNIPLVIISADRPKHLIDIGDGQTIRQEHVFQNHILYSANLIEDTSKKELNVNLTAEALHVASSKKGPIHINVPFDEPLYETVEVMQEIQFPKITINSIKKTQIDFNGVFHTWSTSSKKMILVGAHCPDNELQEVIHKFTTDPSVIILTETTSNLMSKNVVNSIDQLIFPFSDEEFEEHQPEVLVTFGGMIVSKKIKQFLRKFQPNHHWHIDELKPMNTFHCLTEFIQEKPSKFLSKLSVNNSVNSTYKQIWLTKKLDRSIRHKQYLKTIPFSDLKVFEQVLKRIPENFQLQISNSSVIRYTQLFDIDDSLHVYCNRGTSGIDGSTSTAIGAAVAGKNKTVFLTGDLSFFYDSNALWNNYIPCSFRIIIINNSGGGIFRFIPGPKTTNALDYFETPHHLNAEQLCNMYQLSYVSVSNLSSLHHALNSFYEESNRPIIMEIFTDKKLNEGVLKEYFNNLK